ncbi:TPA: hypothetical protein ACXC99_003639 [Clostridium botulinum]
MKFCYESIDSGQECKRCCLLCKIHCKEVCPFLDFQRYKNGCKECDLQLDSIDEYKR